jgi:ATP-dependent exoDNAse (exonuclease V) alpha subunit
MAIYHFSGTVISRSQGRSAVACSAYRSSEKLYDERCDREHDYTHKQDVANAEILLPDNAPQWMADREKLWNAVETHEKRKDAQLAREFNFALPRELTLEQNITLAREFVKETFVSKGMVADLCIHNDKQLDGQLHPHAHVMLTMREVTQDGFGKKVRAWNDRAMLLNWREQWAEVANKHLALHGHDLRIDHRTLVEQGISLEPQHKIGATVARDRLVRMEDHQRIARENGDKLFADPSIALNAITRQQSTFTHQDIARFVNRHTVNAEQFSLVYDKVKSHESIVMLGKDDKDRERFTTREMLNLESKMMERAEGMSKSKKPTKRKRCLKNHSR